MQESNSDDDDDDKYSDSEEGKYFYQKDLENGKNVKIIKEKSSE